MQTVKTPTYDADGRLTGIQGIFWDITEIKQAQETLQQAHDELENRVQKRTQELAGANARLKELDRLKDQFIEDMSHELRTPLSNLSLHLDLLEMGNPDKRDRYLAVLRQSTQRLTHLSQDILTVTRINLNRDDIQTSLLDLNEIIASMTSQYRQMAEENGLTLIVDAAPLPTIRANREHIRQVIANLLVNSLNYTPEGQIQIQTGVDEARQMVYLQVKDTGIGIEADDLPFVFDRFYRGQKVSQLTIPGSGLGLAVVKEIVNLHGGSIEVESEPGAGAVFRVWLPIASE